MAVACYIIFSQNSAFQAASAARDQANRDVENAAKDKKNADDAPKRRRFAAAPDTPDEEAKFLNYLRQHAALYKVQLVSETSATTEYGKDRSTAILDPKIAELLKGIRKISCNITLSGPYAGLRQLMGELEASDRLFTLSNLSWNRTENGNRLSMIVGRYVAPAAPKPPPTP